MLTHHGSAGHNLGAMTDYPAPWVFALICLCSVRCVHLILWDSIIGTHNDADTALADRLQAWAYTREREPRGWWRAKVRDLLNCPMCTGFWCSLVTVCVASWSAPWTLGNVGWVVVGAVWCVQCVLSILDYRFIVE